MAAIVFVTTFAVFLVSPVRPLADSYYSLLVSEQLLTRGSFTLDEHFTIPLDPRRYPGINGTRGPYPYQIETVDGHQYYFFPAGSSVLSLPFVAAMRAAGLSTIDRDGTYNRRGERGMQAVLASFLMAVLAVIFYATARLLLPVVRFPARSWRRWWRGCTSCGRPTPSSWSGSASTSSSAIDGAGGAISSWAGPGWLS
jgi:hypothetical protein